jgi:hypothetical protein
VKNGKENSRVAWNSTRETFSFGRSNSSEEMESTALKLVKSQWTVNSSSN